jgi:hypothetical protein
VVIALIVSFVAIKIWDFRRLPEPPMAALPPRTSQVAEATPRGDSVPPITTAPATAPQSATQRPPTTVTTNVPATVAPIAAPTAAPSAPPSTPPPAPQIAPPPPPVTQPVDNRASMLSRFDSLADSLDHTLHNYQDRRSDFAAKRLSCTELAYGYRAADEALVGLAKLAGDTRALDAQRKSRYNGLIAGMDTVNDDFDGSKCKRL